MTTCLVTGASGFVGSALAERLAREGHVVRVIARDEASGAALVARGYAVHVASLGDPNAIAAAAEGVELLYHCAAENAPTAPERALAWVNVAGSENVRNAARHAGVRRLVHVSCADVTLIDRDRVNWKETRQLDEPALDAVCRTKLLAEELALQSSDSALEVCAIRPAWVWGPGDRRTLPALCREAARGRVQLCGDGHNLLPTTYIDNLVDALILAGAAAAVGGKAFHVFDTEALTAREFLGKLCAALGVAPPARGIYRLAYAAAWLRERTGRAGLSRAEVARRGRSALFDGLAAATQLGFTPKVDIDQGMAALKAWVEREGGPSALARIERTPTSARELDSFMRLAESSPA